MGAGHSYYELRCPSCTHLHRVKASRIDTSLKCPDCGIPMVCLHEGYCYAQAMCRQQHRNSVYYRANLWRPSTFMQTCCNECHEQLDLTIK